MKIDINALLYVVKSAESWDVVQLVPTYKDNAKNSHRSVTTYHGTLAQALNKAHDALVGKKLEGADNSLNATIDAVREASQEILAASSRLEHQIKTHVGLLI